MIPEADLVERLDYQKNKADTLFLASRENIRVFVSMKGSIVVEVKGEHMPDKFTAKYYVLKDSAGKVLRISEIPSNESGEHHLQLTHYFDQEGKTFSIEKVVNEFNSGCTEGVAYETTVYYYNSTFEPVYKDYTLKDKDGNHLKKDDCNLHEMDFKKWATLGEYLEAKGIGIKSR